MIIIITTIIIIEKLKRVENWVIADFNNNNINLFCFQTMVAQIKGLLFLILNLK